MSQTPMVWSRDPTSTSVGFGVQLASQALTEFASTIAVRFPVDASKIVTGFP
jgi:hypothetical protein